MLFDPGGLPLSSRESPVSAAIRSNKRVESTLKRTKLERCRRWLKPVIGMLIAIAVLIHGPTGASAQTCTLPGSIAAALPDTVPAPGPYATIRDQGVPFADVNLGVGHLRPTESTWDWQWLTKITLPLSDAPGSPPRAWIAGGWIVEVGTERVAPFRVSGLVETGYEEATFIVLETSAEGWIRIRFAPGDDQTGEGTAWVPECALDGDPIDLEPEPWQDRLLSNEISPLFFRSDEAPLLRASPSVDAEIVRAVAGDYHLEPLEVDGDWMRVTLKQPSDYCVSPAGVLTETGWIRWRTPERGPEVWYSTRGC